MTEIRVCPKLVVDDADRAIIFYQAVLGARLQTRYTAGRQVVFAQLSLPGGDIVQVKDADQADPAPPAAGGGVILDVLCEDPDAVTARAVEHGARVVFDVEDRSYGARQGRFRDPFGHQWLVGTPVSLDDQQVQQALNEPGAGE